VEEEVRDRPALLAATSAMDKMDPPSAKTRQIRGTRGASAKMYFRKGSNL